MLVAPQVGKVHLHKAEPPPIRVGSLETAGLLQKMKNSMTLSFDLVLDKFDSRSRLCAVGDTPVNQTLMFANFHKPQNHMKWQKMVKILKYQFSCILF